MMHHIFIKILVLLFFIAGSISLKAQVKGLSWERLNGSSNSLEGKLQGEAYFLSPVSNSYYFLQRDWTKGTVELVDGVIFKEQHLRYNAYRDQLVMFNENRNDLFTVDKEIVSSFEYEKEGKMIRFVRLPFETFFSKTSFFRILYEGNQKLLARHFVREVKVSPYKDKNNVLRDTEFRSEIDYYLYNGKGEYKKLQLKRKSLLSISPENKKEVKRLLRANRLDFLSEFSLIQAIQLLEENGYIK